MASSSQDLQGCGASEAADLTHDVDILSQEPSSMPSTMLQNKSKKRKNHRGGKKKKGKCSSQRDDHVLAIPLAEDGMQSTVADVNVPTNMSDAVFSTPVEAIESEDEAVQTGNTVADRLDGPPQASRKAHRAWRKRMNRKVRKAEKQDANTVGGVLDATPVDLPLSPQPLIAVRGGAISDLWIAESRKRNRGKETALVVVDAKATDERASLVVEHRETTLQNEEGDTTNKDKAKDTEIEKADDPLAGDDAVTAVTQGDQLSGEEVINGQVSDEYILTVEELTTNRDEEAPVISAGDASVARDDENAVVDREAVNLQDLAEDVAVNINNPGPTLPPSRSQLWEIRPLPKKGLAFIATHPIKCGTRILAEPPLLEISADKVASLPYDFITLRAHQKSLYLSLTAAHEPARDTLLTAMIRDFENCIDAGMFTFPKTGLSVEEQVHIISIWDTNTFATDEGSALCVTASRMNHSCIPNVYHCWNRNIGKVTMHAIRDIAVGEEILTSYLLARLNLRERQERLATYGFKCDCVACDTSTRRGRRSFERRELLSRAEQVLYNVDVEALVDRQQIARFRSLVMDCVKALSEEGIPNMDMVRYYLKLSGLASAGDDYPQACHWATKALQLTEISTGTDHPQYRTVMMRLRQLMSRL